MIDYSQHAALRIAQWHLTDEQIEYVMNYGFRLHRAGALIYYLRKRDIPEWDRSDDACMRLAGTAVVLTRDGRRLITTWRNQRNGLKRIKHKSKYELTADQLGWAG